MPCGETDEYWLRLDRTQGLRCLLCRAVFSRVTELIESKKKKQLSKTLQGNGGAKNKVWSRARRPWKAHSRNDKSVAVITRDEKQHLSNKARRRLPLSPVRKRMHREHKRNYLHASFVVCQNWHVFKDLGVLIIWHPESRRVNKRQPVGRHYLNQTHLFFHRGKASSGINNDC